MEMIGILQQYAIQEIVSIKAHWKPELIGGAAHTIDGCSSDISAVIQYSTDSRGANTRSLGDILQACSPSWHWTLQDDCIIITTGTSFDVKPVGSCWNERA